MKRLMKQTLELFKLDWKRIFQNKLTFVLIIALMIIPSLYAWFNIAALWDPYSNTKDIAIAVYSDDKTATVMDQEINIGDKIITNLKKNKTVGWQFVDSKAELDKGVKSGKYYGGIYLPEDFSTNLISFVNGDIQKPEIEYSVNQKINAIAPKITDKGAGAIKETISTEFVSTVSDTLLKTFNEIGYDLDANLASVNKITSKILTVDDNLDKIDGYTKEVIALNKKMPDYKGKLEKANEFIEYLPEVDKLGKKVVEVNGMMPQVKEAGKLILTLQEKIPEIEEAGKQVAMIDEDFDDIVKIMDEAIVEAKKGIEIVQSAQTVLPEVAEMAKTANKVIPEVSEKISQVEESLPQIAEGVDTGIHIIKVIAESISTTTAELATIVGEHELTPEKKAEIQQELQKLSNSLTGMSNMISSTIDMMEKLQEISGSNRLDPVIAQLTASQQAVGNLQAVVDRVLANSDNWSSQELQQELVTISNQAASLVAGLNKINPGAIAQEVSKMLTDIQSMLQSANKITNKIVDEDLITKLDALMTSTTKTVTQAVGFLEKYQKELPVVKQEIHSANELLNNNMPTIVGGINKAADLYQNDLPELEKKMAKASTFVQNDLPKLEKELTTTMKMVNEKMPKVEEALTTATSMIEKDWPNIRSGVHKAAGLIRKGQKDIDLTELIKLLKSDAAAESDFIANPVLINQTDVYPVPNNGSASAPFYTALCLWVGAVLFSSIATTDFHLSDEQKKKYSKQAQFLARMGTFLVVGFFQALIVSLGNLWLLGTYAVSPVFSVLFALLVGLTFMMMVYVLVALFGNLGKGAAVIILVLSISAGGGNYPIEMSGKFFQLIHPLLPFTHAVNLLREPVGGIYWPNAIKAIIILVMIGIAFFAIGLFLFPRVKGFFKKLNTNLQEGHILH